MASLGLRALHGAEALQAEVPAIHRARGQTLSHLAEIRAEPYRSSLLLRDHLLAPAARYPAKKASRTAKDGLVQIVVDVTIYDQKNEKVLWERKGLMLEGDYETGKERDGRKKALEKLTTNIVDGAQSQW